MNLLHIDLSHNINTFYFNNVSLAEILYYFGEENQTELLEVYGNKDNIFYRELPLPKIFSNGDLIKIVRKYPTIFLKLKIKELEIEINDEMEYIITSTTDLGNIIIELSLNLLNFDFNLYPNYRKEFDKKYLLINNNKIVHIFKTFDEYLQSDYSI